MKYRNVINKIIVTIIMILLSIMLMNNSVLAAPTSGISSAIGGALNENSTANSTTLLDQFIKKYGIKSDTDIEKILKKIEFRDVQSQYNCDSQVNGIIQDIANYKDAEKIKKLDSAFADKCKEINFGEEVKNINELDQTDPFYKYYGYKLGQEKVLLQSAQEEVGNTNGKTDEELQKQFDEKLKEYQNLSDGEKNYANAKKYYEALMAINDKITDKKQSSDNLSKIDEVYTTVVDEQPQIDENNDDNAQVHKDAVLGESSASSSHTVDEVINEAQGFIQKGDSEKIDASELKKASDTLYNILLAIGVIATVIVGLYLAIKYMVSSLEEQAKIKESIIPYIVGCVVIYGAFIIWKLAILLLRGIS